MNIDLSQLPAPSIIDELNFEEIFLRRKADFLALVLPEQKDIWQERLELESEPVVKLLQENAYMELLIRARINEAVRATFLATATGADLDVKCADYDVKRLVIEPATDDKPAVLEDDESLRKRAQLFYESFSTAGPEGSYKFHALSADGRIKDVSITSPEPGEILVAVMTYSDDLNQDVVDNIYQKLNDEKVRPLCDHVTVQQVNVVPYQIEAEITLFPTVFKDNVVVAINQSIQRFIEENNRIGIDVTRSAVIAHLHVQGVQNVRLNQPTEDVVITKLQVAKNTSMNLIIRDVTDE